MRRLLRGAGVEPPFASVSRYLSMRHAARERGPSSAIGCKASAHAAPSEGLARPHHGCHCFVSMSKCGLRSTNLDAAFFSSVAA